MTSMAQGFEEHGIPIFWTDEWAAAPVVTLDDFPLRLLGRATDEERAGLLEQLATVLAERLRANGGERAFHDAARAVVAELGTRGHDLFCFDESEGASLWIPAPSRSTRLIVRFTRRGVVRVEWARKG
jgi:hypothetical protein